jgi:hypothetical protein
MPALPAKFTSGRPLLSELSAERLNGILDEIRRNKPLVEKGLSARVTGSGTYIGLCKNFNGGAAGAPTETHPFKIASSGDSVTVQPGTINSVLPSNTFDGGALRQFGVSPDTLSYVVLTASSDGSQITTAALSVETTAPPAQTPAAFGVPASAEWLLAVVYNSSVHQIIDDNLVVTGTQQFIADRDGTPEVGQLPYVAYFVWA